MSFRIDNNSQIYSTEKKQQPKQAAAQKDYTAMIAEEMLKSSVAGLEQATKGNPIMSAVTGVIMNVMGLGATDETQATQATQQTQDTGKVDTAAINKTKQSLESQLAPFKSVGVTVSDFDENNTCKLSWNGNEVTISIADDGSSQMTGDIGPIMEHLKANNPAEAESVKKQSEFLDKQEAAGDPIVGPSKATSINVNGKSVDVNEYTTQSGKKLYLDGSGNEVKPETSMT